MAEKLSHDLEWIADRSVRLYLRTLSSTGIRVLGQAWAARQPHRSLDSASCAGSAGSPRRAARSTADRLAAMSATLVHRGPDSEGTFVDGGVGLAARRLAIIDLAGGDQPISNEDGTCTVVQNGEIYNYAELNRELERAGHRFRTHSDTETIVHAYEEWGLGFAERLRGMFAVAIWDARARAARARARPLRDQAALLPRRRRGARRSPPSSTRCRRASSTSTRSRRSWRSTPFPRRSRSSARSASCRPGTC